MEVAYNCHKLSLLSFQWGIVIVLNVDILDQVTIVCDQIILNDFFNENTLLESNVIKQKDKCLFEGAVLGIL